MSIPQKCFSPAKATRGRQLTTTTPNGTISTTYDGLGLALTNIDEENCTTTYGYNLASQLLNVKDALNQTTLTYHPAGNKPTQQDANTHTTTYTWVNLNIASTNTGKPRSWRHVPCFPHCRGKTVWENREQLGKP